MILLSDKHIILPMEDELAIVFNYYKILTCNHETKAGLLCNCNLKIGMNVQRKSFVIPRRELRDDQE